ncbi:hypothetical protein AVEN_21691-1 [Araneus ventricosus]|uniref:Uncharacterized protein n=1 Tax=Araneus ventricosus TaxID=182803 RepID=A0A4Y2L017_ARAVE|nr:hypothetical protein AVEN_21691-1 [Araneus ventricosus]
MNLPAHEPHRFFLFRRWEITRTLDDTRGKTSRWDAALVYCQQPVMKLWSLQFFKYGVKWHIPQNMATCWLSSGWSIVTHNVSNDLAMELLFFFNPYRLHPPTGYNAHRDHLERFIDNENIIKFWT